MDIVDSQPRAVGWQRYICSALLLAIRDLREEIASSVLLAIINDYEFFVLIAPYVSSLDALKDLFDGVFLVVDGNHHG